MAAWCSLTIAEGNVARRVRPRRCSPHEPLTAPLVAAPAPPVDVLLTRLDPGLPVPAYARPGDAGVDLRCTADVVLGAG